MDFGSEMLSVDHADISKRDIGNNRSISWENGNVSKVGTVFVYLLSNFLFDNNLLIVVHSILTFYLAK
jgi:hypothetical protein